MAPPQASPVRSSSSSSGRRARSSGRRARSSGARSSGLRKRRSSESSTSMSEGTHLAFTKFYNKVAEKVDREKKEKKALKKEKKALKKQSKKKAKERALQAVEELEKEAAAEEVKVEGPPDPKASAKKRRKSG